MSRANSKQRAWAGEVVEAGAADLGRPIDVDRAQQGPQFDVIANLRLEGRDRADLAHDDVVVLATGRGALDDVGDGQVRLAQGLLGGCLHGLCGLDVAGQRRGRG